MIVTKRAVTCIERHIYELDDIPFTDNHTRTVQDIESKRLSYTVPTKCHELYSINKRRLADVTQDRDDNIVKPVTLTAKISFQF
jgi:hypothetical protein